MIQTPKEILRPEFIIIFFSYSRIFRYPISLFSELWVILSLPLHDVVLPWPVQ